MYTKRIKMCGCISFFLFFIVACSNPKYDFKSKEVVEYETRELDTCLLIEEVENDVVMEHHRQENKITINKNKVTCSTVNVRKLGKHETVIKVNGVEHTLFFNVEDNISPDITAEDEYIVEQDNEYFHFEKMVNVIDLYDNNPIIGFTGDYDLSKAGEYLVKISAKDSSNNESNREVKIKVIEKEVIIKEQIVYQPNDSTHVSMPNDSQNSTSGSSTGGSNTTVISPLSVKYFSAEEGYNQKTAFDTCRLYRGDKGGSCTPYNRPNGLYAGHVYQP